MLSGTKFGSAGAVVHVGSTECVVDTQTDTQIECTTGDHEAGTFKVTVNVKNRGLASGSFTHTYSLSVNSVSPDSGEL